MPILQGFGRWGALATAPAVGTGGYADFASNGGIGATGGLSSFTVSYPSGVQANDIILFHFVSRDDLGNADVSTLSDAGFALVQTVYTGGTVDTISSLYWKRATGSESGSVTVTLTESINTSVAAGIMSRWAGCITTGTPYESIAINQQLTNTTAATGNTISTLGSNRKVVSFFGHADRLSLSFGDASGTNTNGWSEHYDDKTPAGDGYTFSCNSVLAPSAASVSACTRTIATAVTNICHTLALIPA